MTCLLVPFVTCSARLTVYVLLAGAFFGDQAGSVVFAMYVLSISLVVVAGIALRHTVFRHQPRESLVLELPPYRVPTVRVVAAQSWQKLAGFVRTTGGIIVVTVLAVWLLAAIPAGAGRFNQVEPADSLYGTVSRTVAPVFAPAGFADWRITGALLTGFVAKEAVVSTLAQTHRADQPSDLRRPGELGVRLHSTVDHASGSHPVAAVLALLVFVLAYTPCLATVAAQRAEIGVRWTAVGVGTQLLIAWLLATFVFQIGRLVL
jgi:ferrous iron transport protein B